MIWSAVGSFALWTLAITLASLGGGMMHAALTESPGSGPFDTVASLLLILTAAAIYRQRLR